MVVLCVECSAHYVGVRRRILFLFVVVVVVVVVYHYDSSLSLSLCHVVLNCFCSSWCPSVVVAVVVKKDRFFSIPCSLFILSVYIQCYYYTSYYISYVDRYVVCGSISWVLLLCVRDSMAVQLCPVDCYYCGSVHTALSLSCRCQHRAFNLHTQ